MIVTTRNPANIVRQRYSSLYWPLDANILRRGRPKWSPYECSNDMFDGKTKPLLSSSNRFIFFGKYLAIDFSFLSFTQKSVKKVLIFSNEVKTCAEEYSRYWTTLSDNFLLFIEKCVETYGICSFICDLGWFIIWSSLFYCRFQ